MKMSFKGINEKVVTFLVSGTVTAGDFVKVTSNNTVASCSENDVFAGVAVGVNGGLCSVQVSGCAEVKINSTLNLGYQCLGVDSGNGATAVTGGRPCTVINSDSTAGTATILF